MKKLIAILMVLAIVAGFVFAETHTLDVTASVNAVEPAFQLGAADSGTAAADGAVTDNSTPDVFDVSASYTGSFASALKLDQGGSFVVIPLLVNNARSNKPYTLTFTGGTFTAVSISGVAGQSIAPSSVTTAKNSATITGITSITPDDANEKLRVVFSGKTASASTGAPVYLGTVTFNYNARPNVDMGEYHANITMTVTQE